MTGLRQRTNLDDLRVCSLLARPGQAHYSEIRSLLGLGAKAWRWARGRLLGQGRIVEAFPGMYELAEEEGEGTMVQQEVKGIIFDLDGVIVDTARFHFLAWQRLARELGIEFTEKDNERLKGVSRMRSLEIILEIGGRSASQEKKEAWAARKNAYYREFVEALTPDDILPGILDLLEDLERQGILLAVASASRNAPLVLERIGLSERFDAKVDGNDLTRPKPDPEIFLLATQRLGLPPSSCAVIEDAAVGVKAARAAGMRAIGIGDPRALGEAALVVASPADLTAEKVLGLPARIEG